jgi:hypothetical protein
MQSIQDFNAKSDILMEKLRNDMSDSKSLSLLYYLNRTTLDTIASVSLIKFNNIPFLVFF